MRERRLAGFSDVIEDKLHRISSNASIRFVIQIERSQHSVNGVRKAGGLAVQRADDQKAADLIPNGQESRGSRSP
jgi:hypothetical protein